MTQEEKILLNRCELTAKDIKRISQEYSTPLCDCPDIIHQLHKAENRSQEYSNGSFIILVVGPVKSGKSTLVNLIANAYVSPTHFFECTVRPSIISKKRDGEECLIHVFTSEVPQRRVEQIDAIIDTIRGIEQASTLTGIQQGSYPLTRTNIEEKVELGLNESLSAKTLITSITTPGGRLMQDNIFIVDMPGFDGSYANIDDPVYDAIAQRADLIIFVQSSNSAVSKLSGQFLQKLHDNNKNVPVCLIHNIFESAYWHNDDEKARVVEEQKSFAIEEIRRKGFNIDESQCFSINLGKVKDARDPSFGDLTPLQEEARLFHQIEDTLYQRVIHHRDVIRLSVCLGRTMQQIEQLADIIAKEQVRRNETLKEYQKVTGLFDAIREEKTLVGSGETLVFDPPPLRALVVGECERQINDITEGLRKNDSDAKEVVENYIERCEMLLNKTLPSCLSLNAKEEELYLRYLKRIAEIQSTIQACGGGLVTPNEQKQHYDDIPPITLDNAVNLDTLVPHRFYIPIIHRGGHSSEDLIQYLRSAAANLVGHQSENKSSGYIETFALAPILEQMEEKTKEIIARYAASCRKTLEDNEQALLARIIKDKQRFDEESRQMDALLAELQQILT